MGRIAIAAASHRFRVAMRPHAPIQELAWNISDSLAATLTAVSRVLVGAWLDRRKARRGPANPAEPLSSHMGCTCEIGSDWVASEHRNRVIPGVE